MKLIIANKTHSSWSLRPWLVLKQFGIPFEEVLIPFGPTMDDPGWKRAVAEYTPARKVPSLVDGAIAVWDSLAIIEYVAETHPELPIWPRDRSARALARSICAEMHSSFGALRGACPMNLAWVHPARDRGEAVAADIARITEIWRDARQRFGAGGDFLFGEFSAADAMFAPVATRFTTYSIALDPVSAAYVEAVQGTAGFKAWRDAALAEPWIVSVDELDEPILTDFRPNLSRSRAQT
ncbi:MAG TPA: glutathione S-transferase family protein [Bosea sp. (in: a-proteobacteria)]|nr:glutathione S-transferase family protein [Bosea sp. (in: a-proteobacteria)]